MKGSSHLTPGGTAMPVDAADADDPEAGGKPGGPRYDRLSALMALATVLLVGWTLWLRFGPAPAAEPPTVGSALPPLRLLDLETSEPLVLVGLKGKVVWLVFWTSEAPTGEQVLARLEPVWKRFRAHRRFSLVAAAADSARPERARAAIARAGATLPAYLVGPETCRRLGVDRADPPLHILLDAQGRVAATARSANPATIDRLAAQVAGWLEELDPLGETRFARSRPSRPDPDSPTPRGIPLWAAPRPVSVGLGASSFAPDALEAGTWAGMGAAPTSG